MKHITRRKFIKMSLSAAAMSSAAPLLNGCSEKSITNPKIGDATVSIIRGSNLDAMTRDAIDAIGGINNTIEKGDIVFIKPNFVTFPWAQTNNCFATGECTKTEILIAVTEECLKAGAAEVIIGEGSHLPSFDWKYATNLNRSTNLVIEADRLNSKYDGNVILACLEVDSPKWVEVPSRSYLDNIAISSLASEADKVISIPVAKTHSWAQLTLALKNFIGITPLERYAVWINNSHWDRGQGLDHSSPQAIAQIYLDIVDALKPDLTIIDFSIGIEGNGPTKGSGGITVDMRERLGSWLILASTDIMAADATTARIMNYNVGDVKQLQMGHNMGLGEINEESIQIIGEKIKDVRVDWRPAELRNQTAHYLDTV